MSMHRFQQSLLGFGRMGSRDGRGAFGVSGGKGRQHLSMIGYHPLKALWARTVSSPQRSDKKPVALQNQNGIPVARGLMDVAMKRAVGIQGLLKIAAADRGLVRALQFHQLGQNGIRYALGGTACEIAFNHHAYIHEVGNKRLIDVHHSGALIRQDANQPFAFQPLKRRAYRHMRHAEAGG
nr:hypothetical protein [Brenneria sp. CFCC 11842]